jgi:glycosyltransferase involved in cell wall biosynthesis
MKVFFDARMIGHPGIGRYIKSLLRQILQSQEVELNILGDRELIESFLGPQKNIIYFNFPIYSIGEQFGFKMLKSTVKDNILHIPHYNIPITAKFKLVATIHDLNHILYPAGASSKLAPWYMKFMMQKVSKRAKKIIFVSNFTKECFTNLFPIQEQRAEVIPEGADDNFCKIEDNNYLEEMRAKYGLPLKFILYVGSIRRHKNIDTLLKVFEKIKVKIPDLFLVLVGKFSHQISLVRKGVLYLGEVPRDKELSAIYNLAQCFCNLSFQEGFGLTILEAQKCGTPVVCSDIITHKETGEKGILTTNPTDIDQIQGVLYNVLTDNKLRNTLIQKGFENVQRFRWQDTADKTMDVYRGLLKD